MGRFFKAHWVREEDGRELWEGFEVREEKVRVNVPSRVLRVFMNGGLLSRPRYKKLLGSAR